MANRRQVLQVSARRRRIGSATPDPGAVLDFGNRSNQLPFGFADRRHLDPLAQTATAHIVARPRHAVMTG